LPSDYTIFLNRGALHGARIAQYVRTLRHTMRTLADESADDRTTGAEREVLHAHAPQMSARVDEDGLEAGRFAGPEIHLL
jgi:hypothetical protein